MSLALLSTAAMGLLISPAPPRFASSATSGPRAAVKMAMDYKDPVVASEMATVQQLSPDEVESELNECGVVAPPTMNDMELRLMLVEMRLRKSGRMDGGSSKPPPPPPSSFGSEFERALYEHPAFGKLYNGWKNNGDTNRMNLAIEYMNTPKRAVEVYGKQYAKEIEQIKEAMDAPVVQEVTSPRLSFGGFPGNMGEGGVRMTLEAIGTLANFSAEQTADGTAMEGFAEFEDVDTAKAAIDKYDGMDMGTGTKLSLRAL